MYPTKYISRNAIDSSKLVSNILLLIIFVSLTFFFQLRVPGAGYWATMANLLIVIMSAVFIIYMLHTKSSRMATKLDFAYLLMVISISYALVKGFLTVGLKPEFLSDMRVFIQFPLYFLVTSLKFDQKSWNSLIQKTMLVIIISGLIVSIYSLFIVLAGYDHVLDLSDPWGNEGMEVLGSTRTAALVPAGVFMVMPFLLIGLLMIKKIPLSLFLPLMVIDIVATTYTLTRSIWVGLVVSFICFLFIFKKEKKIIKIISWLFFSMIAVLYLMAATGPGLESLVEERTEMFFSTSPEDVGSMGHRIEESKAYLNLFWKNPILGAGLGAEVEFYSEALKKYVSRGNWHNAYPMLLGKLGILGLAGFLLIIFNLFRETFFIMRHDPDPGVNILIRIFIVIMINLLVTTLAIGSLFSFSLTILFVLISAIIAMYAASLRQNLRRKLQVV